MDIEIQNKLWSELSDETKQEYINAYNFHIEHSEMPEECEDGGYDLTVLRSETIAKELVNMFGLHNLTAPIGPTYAEINEKLYEHKCNIIQFMSTTSVLHERKITAINKILEVAKFFNGDWKPDFDDDSKLWYIYLDYRDDEEGKVKVHWKLHTSANSEFVYFRTEEFALMCIKILGEETIRTALKEY